MVHRLLCLLVFQALSHPVHTKGVISFGKGGGRPRGVDYSPAESNPFRFALFSPTYRIPTASDCFMKFIDRAVETRLRESEQRLYYFLPDGAGDEDCLSDPDVCQATVKAWKLTSTSYHFNDTDAWVTIHFLCGRYCCGTDCCEMNELFLVCLTFLAIILLSTVLWLYCRYGKRQCAWIKRLQQITIADAQEASQLQMADSPLLNECHATQTHHQITIREHFALA